MLPIQSTLRAIANPEKARVLSGFFKTGKGQYGEGDHFLGIQVPDTRKVMKQYLSEMNLEKVETLLQSEFHEERLAGVLCLVELAKYSIKNSLFCHSVAKCNGAEESLSISPQETLGIHFSKAKEKGIRRGEGQKQGYSIQQLADFYMSHRECINNWDLVDTSAPQIIGPYIADCLTHEERVKFVDDCIASQHLWTNRIIVLASFYNINKLKDEKLTFYIVKKILRRIPARSLRGTRQSRKTKTLDSGTSQEGQNDIYFNSLNHDLMNKASGWMLREVGKRVSEARLCEFLDEYASQMPRTMLRYAIERLDKEKKERYMKKA